MLDISELTGDLLTVGMFVALDFVWDKANVVIGTEEAAAPLKVGDLHDLRLGEMENSLNALGLLVIRRLCVQRFMLCV